MNLKKVNRVINSDISYKKWLILLNKSFFSSPFQSPEAYKSYNKIKGFSSDVFAIEIGSEYKALVIVTIQKEKGIKGYFSKRGIIYGGPLLISTDEIIFEKLIEFVKDFYKRKLIFLEVRNSFNYDFFTGLYSKYGWIYENRLNVKLNIENKNTDDILSKMKYNRRREIKLSYKENVFKRFAKDENEVVLLYDILKNLYINRVKLPLPDISFFLNLFKSDIGKVFVVIHNNKLIGGAFCFYDKSTIYTSYYVGLRAYHKKIFPTHIAIMGVIEFAIENDLKLIDFMGAGKPNEDYGVRDYKLQFGGDLVEDGRYNNIFNPFLYKIGVLGLNLLSKIN